MGFQQTLRWVQVARALNIIFTCISVIIFSFILDMRFKARKHFIEGMQGALPDVYDKSPVQRSSFGSMALFGLALSLVWSGLCLFDLAIKKHYRFDRRICIFIDMIVAVALLVTGFLNFAYDAVLYFALDVTKPIQITLEIVAVIFLAISCIFHLAFFCYGCKDPAAEALEFEHVALEPTSPIMGHLDYADLRVMRSRANTTSDMSGPGARGLVEIDLGKKVQITKIQQRLADGSRSPRSPPKTPLAEGDMRRSGFIGAPAAIATPKSHGTPRMMGEPQPRTPPSEESPFFSDEERKAKEWI